MPDAQGPRLPETTDAHRRLEVFVGNWRHEASLYGDGQQADDALASAVSWTSDESSEWLPGGFFLLHRWDSMAGKREFKGTEILGYDEAQGGYFTSLLDNVGNHPDYRAAIDGNVWNFTEPATRATVTVSDDDDRLTLKWEWRNGGSDWLPLSNRVATRAALGGSGVWDG